MINLFPVILDPTNRSGGWFYVDIGGVFFSENFPTPKLHWFEIFHHSTLEKSLQTAYSTWNTPKVTLFYAFSGRVRDLVQTMNILHWWLQSNVWHGRTSERKVHHLCRRNHPPERLAGPRTWAASRIWVLMGTRLDESGKKILRQHWDSIGTIIHRISAPKMDRA